MKLYNETMKSCLIHGCYDEATLKTLLQSGATRIAFDLRPRSPNLVTYRDLTHLLKFVTSEEVVLTFENDLPSTILSYLDLLKHTSFKFVLEFRDHLPTAIYSSIGKDFYWMFHPDHNWQEILTLPEARGVLLPLKYKDLYARMPELWKTIEDHELRVFLHAETLEETMQVMLNHDVEMSLDLTREVESQFRKVDLQKITDSSFWRKLNENPARQ